VEQGRTGEIVFHAAEPAELPLAALREALRERSLAILRGWFDPVAVRAAHQRMAERFDPRLDRKHDPRDADAVRGNLQKLVIGAGPGTTPGRPFPRFMRTFYNPVSAEDVHGMREHLVRLARLRNLLAGLPEDFAVRGVERGNWTAARIQQYPRGGGFLAAHRDVTGRLPRAAPGTSWLRPILLLSKKGENFREGGGYLVPRTGGEAARYEDGCEPGDVAVYDGRSVHGVSDVDPLEPVDLETFSGRVVALVTLYRVLGTR
jgi:hypothetical protein